MSACQAHSLDLHARTRPTTTGTSANFTPHPSPSPSTPPHTCIGPLAYLIHFILKLILTIKKLSTYAPSSAALRAYMLGG